MKNFLFPEIRQSLYNEDFSDEILYLYTIFNTSSIFSPYIFLYNNLFHTSMVETQKCYQTDAKTSLLKIYTLRQP